MGTNITAQWKRSPAPAKEEAARLRAVADAKAKERRGGQIQHAGVNTVANSLSDYHKYHILLF